ncbi:hypothetical protein [Pseudomonas huanghezhanensis]|uniref:hypothetical protein n=1 Tax=Pseudomonas huanghezhanensis TaxID=3002903 RepID=UPI002285EBDC|nr:hypothetical protein [Pseudomonas sp. BSw22131]
MLLAFASAEGVGVRPGGVPFTDDLPGTGSKSNALGVSGSAEVADPWGRCAAHRGLALLIRSYRDFWCAWVLIFSLGRKGLILKLLILPKAGRSFSIRRDLLAVDVITSADCD